VKNIIEGEECLTKLNNINFYKLIFFFFVSCWNWVQ